MVCDSCKKSNIGLKFYAELLSDLCYACANDPILVENIKSSMPTISVKGILGKFVGREVSVKMVEVEAINKTRLISVGRFLVMLKPNQEVTLIPIREVKRYILLGEELTIVL